MLMGNVRRQVWNVAYIVHAKGFVTIQIKKEWTHVTELVAVAAEVAEVAVTTTAEVVNMDVSKLLEQRIVVVVVIIIIVVKLYHVIAARRGGALMPVKPAGLPFHSVVML